MSQDRRRPPAESIVDVLYCSTHLRINKYTNLQPTHVPPDGSKTFHAACTDPIEYNGETKHAAEEGARGNDYTKGRNESVIPNVQAQETKSHKMTTSHQAAIERTSRSQRGSNTSLRSTTGKPGIRQHSSKVTCSRKPNRTMTEGVV